MCHGNGDVGAMTVESEHIVPKTRLSVLFSAITSAQRNLAAERFATTTHTNLTDIPRKQT
jgi:hypothetical protein